jgi:hypothetical protein
MFLRDSYADPDWIRIQWGLWIQEDKKSPQKVNKFNFLKCWMFFFERRRLLLYLELYVLFWRSRDR